MYYVSIDQLPQPPEGKTGFPWTEETRDFLETNLIEDNLYKISIVTPSYNQGDFLEETIRSVLLQNYPNLEYIIIDGGSTDDSLEIIKKYSNYLTYWISEKDHGQCDAINKGLRKISGNIWAYINSDDIYCPGTFYKVIKEFQRNSALLWVTGHAEYIDVSGTSVEKLVPSPFVGMKETLIRWENQRAVAIQVSNFMSSEILEKYGFFDESLHYSMDMEFGLRLLIDQIKPEIVSDVLAKARLHEQSKTVSSGNLGAFLEEDLAIILQFLPKLSEEDQKYVRKKIAECRYFMDLGEVNSFYKKGKLDQFVYKLVEMLARHPNYLFHRATWGMLRRSFSFNQDKD